MYRLPYVSICWFVLLLSLFSVPQALGERVHVAVASNFTETLKRVLKLFEAECEDTVVVSSGSTGKLYAQIKNGAPYEVFLAADAEHPALLEKEGLAVAGTRFTYAVGRLVLWSSKAGCVDSSGAVLEGDSFRKLAIANPKLAPYGAAARQVLEALGRWEAVRPRIVMGENISQTHAFVATGSADLGFVAWSQLKRPGASIAGSYWLPPADSYDAIDQQAVLLRDTPAARALVAFLKTPQAAAIFQEYGYDVPAAEEPQSAASPETTP